MAGAKAYNLVVVTEGTPDVAGSVDTVAKVNELIDGANGGKVTVTVTETDADQLKTIKVGAGSNDLTISVAGASHVAGTLNTIDSVTALQVTTTEITDISGAADKVALALSSTGLDLNGKDINANVNSGTASLTQINDINGDNGTGTVTATLANTTDLADMVDVVNGLTTGIGDSIAITLKAESVSSTDLVTLERKTGLQIDAKAATTITGPYAEVKAVLDDTRNYDFTDADYNVTTSHLTTSLTADELITISGMTSGLVTATSVNTVTGAVDKLLTVANRNDGSDLLLKADYDATIDVSGGTTAAAADLKVILLDTTGTVTADGLTDISGEAADVDAVQTEVSFSHAGDDYTVTIADSANDLTVGEINDIAGRTSGVVTATATSNDIDDYNGTNATLTTGSNDAITIVITNASVDAADLKLLDGKTSVAIDAQAVTNLTGTANEIATIVSSSGVTLDGDFTATVSNEDGQAYVDAADIVTIDTASSGTITATGVTEMRGLADNIVSAATSSEVTIDGDMLFNVTSGEADVAQINTLDALTSNVITATLSDNGAVTLATLKNANANNALTITVTDTEVAASNLSKIDAATTVQVTATAVETLTGTLTAVNSILGAGGVSLTTAGVSAVAASLEDITVAAATVKNVDTLTDGDIAILQATAITGSAADIAAVVSSGGVTHVSGTLQATVDAGSVDAADLITIDDNSGRIVLAAAATTMTGTASEIETVIGRTSGIEVAGTAAATVDDGTATIAQVKTIDNGSRIVTATVDSGVVADLIHGTTGLPDSTKNVLSITVTDTSAAAADLTALAGKTTTKVIVTDVATITGSAGDMVALYDAAASDFTDLGSEALSVSGAAAATDLIALLSDTDQNISVAGVTKVTGTAANLDTVVGNARFTNWTTNNPTLEVSGTSASADDIASLVTTVGTAYSSLTDKIDASGISTFTGTASNVLTTLTSATVDEAANPNVTLSDSTVDAATLILVRAETSATVDVSTATTVSGEASDVNTVLAVGYVTGLGTEAVTLTDTGAVAATTLSSIASRTTGTINASSVATVEGTADAVNTAYGIARISGLGNEAVTLSDTTLDASKLATTDGYTDGVVNVDAATTLEGSASAVAAAFDANDANKSRDWARLAWTP